MYVLLAICNMQFVFAAEKENWQHPAVVAYTDICRIEPGLDHEWAPGTICLFQSCQRTPCPNYIVGDSVPKKSKYIPTDCTLVVDRRANQCQRVGN